MGEDLVDYWRWTRANTGVVLAGAAALVFTSMYYSFRLIHLGIYAVKAAISCR